MPHSLDELHNYTNLVNAFQSVPHKWHALLKSPHHATDDVSISSSWRGCSHTSTKPISVAPLSLAPLVSACPQPDTPTPTWPPATDATQMTPVTRRIHHRNHNAPKFLDMLGHALGLGTCGRQQADVHRTICAPVANVHNFTRLCQP
jgi:hypothetical protein